MAWAFDHGLNTMSPSPLNQFSNGGKFCNLSGIRGIGQAARTQTISDGERDIVLPADFTNVIPTVVHGVLLAVLDHPFGQERSASGNDANHPVTNQRDVFFEHPSVDGEVIHPLLGLMAAGVQDDLSIEVFNLSADDHRVDGHGADRHGALGRNGFSARVEIATGGQVHDCVGVSNVRPTSTFPLPRRCQMKPVMPHVG